MRPLIVGDVIRSKTYPGQTYAVLENTDKGLTLKKLTDDSNVPKTRFMMKHNRPIGSVLQVNHGSFRSNMFDLITDEAVTISNVVELKRPSNVCGCDCGGWTVYQSEASHYHSSWCFVNKKVG